MTGQTAVLTLAVVVLILTPAECVRIYLLNSRMAELHLSPNNVETYDALTGRGPPALNRPVSA